MLMYVLRPATLAAVPTLWLLVACGGATSGSIAGAGGSANTRLTFSCGDSLTCPIATDYCNVTEGGPCCAPPNYTCKPIPAKCSDNPSCDCIQGETGATLCTDAGGVTVTFEYP